MWYNLLTYGGECQFLPVYTWDEAHSNQFIKEDYFYISFSTSFGFAVNTRKWMENISIWCFRQNFFGSDEVHVNKGSAEGVNLRLNQGGKKYYPTWFSIK